MFALRHVRMLWLAGFVVLVLAQVAHAFEHWEIAAHADCVAHADAGDDHGEGGSRHDHGCTSHDHAPAVVGSIFALTVAETVAVVFPTRQIAPALRAVSIDHPPQLS